MKKTLFAFIFAGLVLTGCSSSAAPETPADAPASVEEEAPKQEKTGTRDNPHPIGTTISDGDWDLTVNSVDLDATEAVTADNMFNDAPEEGEVYALINITMTYNGDDPDGEMPMQIVEYVTADGNTIDSYSKMVVAPDSFDTMTTLYNGASATGNIAFPIPAATAADGTFAIKAHMLGDKAFFAVQ